LTVGKTWFGPALGLPSAEEVATGVPVTPRYPTWVTTTILLVPGVLLGGLLGWFIIKPVNRGLGVVFKGFNRGFDAFGRAYGWGVAKMLRVSAIMLIIYGGLLFLTYRTMTRAPTSFIPEQDQGYLLVNLQLPDSASVQRTQEVMVKFQRMMLGDNPEKYQGPAPAKGQKTYPGIPGIGHTLSVAGQSFLLNANGSNFGSCYVILDPFDKRRDHDTYDQVVAQKIRELTGAEIEEAVVSVFRAPPIQGLGNAGGFKFQVQQRGYQDLQELQHSADEMVSDANQDPAHKISLFTMFRAQTPQLYIDIDRTKCESLGVDMQEVFTTLQVYMGGYFVNLFNQFGRTWQVNLLAEQGFRAQAGSIGKLQVRSKAGKMVPLDSVASIRPVVGPVLVMRYNMYASAAISGNSAPGISSGDAIQIVGQMADRLGISYEWTEITYMEILAGNVAMLVFALGSLLIYLVLAAKYENWNQPLAVILVVPMCLLCAVVGMLIAKLAVDIFVQIGFLVLVGLAAKNAILIVEFSVQLRHEGKSLFDATVESCLLRLRPIVMTSFAFILGVVPLMLGHGAGAEMRKSLGTAVFSGMLGVTFFGLVLTPVFFYSLMYFARSKTQPAAEGVRPSPATERMPERALAVSQDGIKQAPTSEHSAERHS
jgi:multidrug efflux pump